MRPNLDTGQTIECVGDQVVISKECKITGELYQLRVPKEKVEVWRNGGLVQKVFPELNPDQREFLMTGITPAEWEKMWENYENND
jgi:hypothetical protein